MPKHRAADAFQVVSRAAIAIGDSLVAPKPLRRRRTPSPNPALVLRAPDRAKGCHPLESASFQPPKSVVLAAQKRLEQALGCSESIFSFRRVLEHHSHPDGPPAGVKIISSTCITPLSATLSPQDTSVTGAVSQKGELFRNSWGTPHRMPLFRKTEALHQFHPPSSPKSSHLCATFFITARKKPGRQKHHTLATPLPNRFGQYGILLDYFLATDPNVPGRQNTTLLPHFYHTFA